MNQKKRKIDGIKRNTKKVSRTRVDTSFVPTGSGGAMSQKKNKPLSGKGVQSSQHTRKDVVLGKKRNTTDFHGLGKGKVTASVKGISSSLLDVESSLEVNNSAAGAYIGNKDLPVNGARKFLLRLISSRPLRFLTLFLLIFILFNHLAYTKVSLRSKMHSVDILETDTAYLYPHADQLGFDVIAVTVDDSLLFESTSTKREDLFATGSVRLFNNYSSSSQRLLPNTRLSSPDGKLFLTPDLEIIIPGKTGETPGVTDVQVTALEPGAASNIDITDFVIPGFKNLGLEEKYTGIYGVSSSAFTGGGFQDVPVLDEAIQQRAKDALRVQLVGKLKKRLHAEKTEDFFLVDRSFSVGDFSFKERQQGSSLVVEGSARATGIIVSRSLLTDYLNQANLLSEEGVSLIEDYRDIDISLVQEGVDTLSATRLPLRLKLTILYRNRFNKDAFIQRYLNKDVSELSSLVEGESDFEYIKVNTIPFWKKRTVDQIEKVRFSVDYEDLLL